jgi:hypothetical protein
MGLCEVSFMRLSPRLWQMGRYNRMEQAAKYPDILLF